jgi:hypothetical protein
MPSGQLLGKLVHTYEVTLGDSLELKCGALSLLMHGKCQGRRRKNHCRPRWEGWGKEAELKQHTCRTVRANRLLSQQISGTTTRLTCVYSEYNDSLGGILYCQNT